METWILTGILVVEAMAVLVSICRQTAEENADMRCWYESDEEAAQAFQKNSENV